MPINRATRSETPEIRRAIPIARPVAQPEIRRAIPVEKGWTPRSANPSADPAVARRKSLFSSGATRAERVPADGPVKQYKGYTALSQLDYPKEKLGNGNKTIATHGCFLTSMTMASTGLTGQKLTPATSNVIVRNGDGFSGGGLEPPRAARAPKTVKHDNEEVRIAARPAATATGQLLGGSRCAPSHCRATRSEDQRIMVPLRVCS